MPKLTVVWTDQDDCAVPDSKIMKTVETAWCCAMDYGEFTLPVANHMAITAIRLLVAQGCISHESIVILLNGEELFLNKYGNLTTYDWPEEWIIGLDWSGMILRCATAMRKEEKENR